MAGPVLDTTPELAEVRRRGHTGLVAAVVLAVIVAGLVWVLATREPAQDKLADSPLLGKVAPPIAGDTLQGGRFDVDDARGRWVVVNFFATWCTPCRVEHPELVKFSERHQDTADAVVVSVSYQDEDDDLRDFFDEQGGDWPVVDDADGRIALDYGVSGIPESFLIAPDGFVVNKIIGGVTADGLDELLGTPGGSEG